MPRHIGATIPAIVTCCEHVDVVRGLLLRLSFEPDAIRDHFDNDPKFADTIESLTYSQLQDLGELALGDDRLYRAFHKSLVRALRVVTTEGAPSAAT